MSDCLIQCEANFFHCLIVNKILSALKDEIVIFNLSLK